MNKVICCWLVLFAAVALSACGGGSGGGGGSTQSSDKSITVFSLAGVSGTINDTNKTIAVTVPIGTDVTALVATFTTTGTSVAVGATLQTSGVTANDFTNPVSYTVTAADNSTVNYTVTVIVPTTAERIAAATATAENSSDCTSISPFYWEIGNSTTALASGSSEKRSEHRLHVGRRFGNQHPICASRQGAHQSQVTAIASHHFDHERALMTGRCAGDGVHRLSNAVQG